MQKSRRNESQILSNIKETKLDKKRTESERSEKQQMNLLVLMTDSSEKWVATENGSLEHSGAIKMKALTLYKSSTIQKRIPPFSPSSANHHLTDDSKYGLTISAPSSDLPPQRKQKSFFISITGLVEHTEEKYFNAISNIKPVKSLEKKGKELRYSTVLSSLFEELNLWKSKQFGSDWKKKLRLRKKGKNEVLVSCLFFPDRRTEH